jgi:hypothetical protein
VLEEERPYNTTSQLIMLDSAINSGGKIKKFNQNAQRLARDDALTLKESQEYLNHATDISVKLREAKVTNDIKISRSIGEYKIQQDRKHKPSW